MQLQTDKFSWESPAITADLNDVGCIFRFRSVMDCPGSKIEQNETEAVELRVAFNCSATESQCGYPERGICNHTSRRCQCKETCGLLKVRYEGEQCEKDPWCQTDIPWIAIGVGSAAFIFTVVACIFNCIYNRRRNRARHGYEHPKDTGDSYESKGGSEGSAEPGSEGE